MSNDTIRILDRHGRPFGDAPRLRPLALNNRSNLPYDSADYRGSNFEGWQPFLWSADGQTNIYRDIVTARARDIVNNDGWATGIVQRTLDNVIGALFRPVAKPDYEALRLYTGNKAFDHVWAEEFGKAADTHFRVWAEDVNRYCDSGRKQTFTQMMRLGFETYLITGDAIAKLNWHPDRLGPGKARYATAVQPIDSDRLSNPNNTYDMLNMRGGVEVDEDDVAVGYHIRRAHIGDWFNAAQSVTWDLIPRETEWGRPVIVHYYEMKREGQHKGGVGILNPIIERLKMLHTMDRKTLERTVIDAILGAYLTSPFDHNLFAEALGVSNEQINAYQEGRMGFHEDRTIRFGDAKIPILFPGEGVTSVQSGHPSEHFGEFENQFLRNFAGATGLSAQQVSNNWADVNYSSARGAILEAWKTLSVRRTLFANGYAAPIRAAWLEESMDVDQYPLPRNAPPFHECRGSYARALWMGPGKGVLDVTKERTGSQMAMDMGLSTLELEAAEQGLDWEEVLDQRKTEIEAFKARGLPLPEWTGVFAVETHESAGDHDPTSPNYKPNS